MRVLSVVCRCVMTAIGMFVDEANDQLQLILQHGPVRYGQAVPELTSQLEKIFVAIAVVAILAVTFLKIMNKVMPELDTAT